MRRIRIHDMVMRVSDKAGWWRRCTICCQRRLDNKAIHDVHLVGPNIRRKIVLVGITISTATATTTISSSRSSVVVIVVVIVAVVVVP